jgi:hypothetical protein
MGSLMILRILLRAPTFAVAAVGLSACAPGEASFYRDALPEVLRTTGIMAMGSDARWFDMVFPIRYEGCGAVVFQLAPETAAQIQQKGLAFFRDARQGRGYPVDSPKGHYYAYASWQSTPAPAGWFGDGVVAASLSCAGLSNSLIRKITIGGRGAEGYFTTKSEAQLIVLPREQIVIFAYLG